MPSLFPVALPLAAIVMLLPAACASTSPKAAASSSVSIPFADSGSISNWRADGTRTLYIESTNRRWYKATLFSPCTDLPFAETIGFVPEATGSLTATSAVTVGRQVCRFKTLEEVEGPPERKDKDGDQAARP